MKTTTALALTLSLLAASPLVPAAHAADQEWLRRQAEQDRARQQAQAAYNAQIRQQSEANAQAARARLQAEADALRARQNQRR